MTSATPQVILYDTTLRDGTQQEGISLTLKDKLDITTKLDELGIHIIEGGWPFSNPKDEEYFQRVRSLPLKTAKIAAFGSTRRAGVTAEAGRQPSGAYCVKGHHHHARRQDMGPARDGRVGNHPGRERADDQRFHLVFEGPRARGAFRRRAFL